MCDVRAEQRQSYLIIPFFPLLSINIFKIRIIKINEHEIVESDATN